MIPLLLCAAWIAWKRRKAPRSWKEGPWFWAFMASIAVAILCLFMLGLREGEHGAYEPAHLEGNTLVPGRMQQ